MKILLSDTTQFLYFFPGEHLITFQEKPPDQSTPKIHSQKITVNVFTELIEKNFLKKIIWTYNPLCNRPWCYHIAKKTPVADRIVKLTPIHASVIYQIVWILSSMEILF